MRFRKRDLLFKLFISILYFSLIIAFMPIVLTNFVIWWLWLGIVLSYNFPNWLLGDNSINQIKNLLKWKKLN